MSDVTFGYRKPMLPAHDFAKKIDVLACPKCKAGSFSVDGCVLRCRSCGADYQIARGVPRFVPADNYATSFGLQWNTHAKTQLDSFSGLKISEDRLFEVSRWPRDMPGQTLLEAGSGAGRFTEVLVKTGASITSFDLSSAVDANFQSNGHNENLLIVQASILDIPVRPRSFDKVMCLGVIQHTPDPQQTFKCLAECVRPGGELVIDVYAARLRSLMSWKYLLRPLTKRMDPKRLYRIIENGVPLLFPLSRALHGLMGRFGQRLLPIVHYPDLPLSHDAALQWSILDTYDMYASAHDHPQSAATIKGWFEAAGFTDIFVDYGPNGVIGRGRRPL